MCVIAWHSVRLSRLVRLVLSHACVCHIHVHNTGLRADLTGEQVDGWALGQQSLLSYGGLVAYLPPSHPSEDSNLQSPFSLISTANNFVRVLAFFNLVGW